MGLEQKLDKKDTGLCQFEHIFSARPQATSVMHFGRSCGCFEVSVGRPSLACGRHLVLWQTRGGRATAMTQCGVCNLFSYVQLIRVEKAT